MRLVCYANRTELAAYIKRQTDTQVVFTIGGATCMMAAPLVAEHDRLYFHLETRRDEVLNVIVDTYHREEFRGCRTRELLQTVEPQESHLRGGSFEGLKPARRVSYRSETRESGWAVPSSDSFCDLMPERNTASGFEVSYRGYGVWSRSEADLMRICHGDKAQFERLVDHAQRRNPGISRQEAIEHAVYWYHRDNR